jgi:uncharacterized protein (DUF1501 family)
MISTGARRLRLCDGVSRRHFLTIGGLTALGVALPDLLRARAAAAAAPPARAQACIFLWLPGGPSTIDMWDPKPDAPAEVRGPFAAIPTAVDGIRFTEHLPKCARVADRLAVVRSLTHGDGNHASAAHLVLTGRPEQGGREYPGYGAVLARTRPPAKPVPPFALLTPAAGGPNMAFRGQGGGFLGRAFDPLRVEDPGQPTMRLPALVPAPLVTSERMELRQEVLAKVEALQGVLEQSPEARLFDRYYQQAFAFLTSGAVKQACDVEREPAATRERYGRDMFGQGCLLARRMVEVGVPFVQVNWNQSIGQAGWDTHQNNFALLQGELLPRLDAALSSLVQELDERDLLKTTLVVCAGEFGRSPRVNGNAGREHHPGCFAAVLAGGGVKRGFALGASDAQGMLPATRPLRPDELAATIYHLLGLDGTRLRELRVLTEQSVAEELLA